MKQRAWQLPWGLNLKKIGLSLLALLIIGGGLAAFGELRTEAGPFSLRLGFAWGWPGESRLVIPPLGEIKVHTHRWPVILSATLERIDLALLQHELLGVTEAGLYLESLLVKLRVGLYWFLAKLCLVGGSAGLLGALLLGRRRWAALWRMAAAGVLSVFLVIGGVLVDFDETAWQNPRYEGVLAAAPWALSLIEEGLDRLPAFSAKLAEMAGSLDTVWAKMNTLSPVTGGEGEVKVLHVSDIHNNPAAIEFIEKVIHGFGVDLVIDTGDLTDYGTALETELNRKINNLGVEYLFIPGNHDSAEVVNRLRKYKNVIVMTKRLYQTNGLTILGWPDPASAGTTSLMPADEELKTEAEALRAYVAGAGRNIHLLAVHNRKMATPAPAGIPVVIHGHTHQPGITQEEGTVYINAGTTGAAGLRGFGNDAIPYSVALLRFHLQDGDYHLAAVDLIRVYGLNGKFILERTVLNKPAGEGGGGERKE